MPHVYVIYKPQLVGVFHKYTTQVQGQRKFISGKLLMTEDEGRIIVEYTTVAVVHMIHTMGMSH